MMLFVLLFGVASVSASEDVSDSVSATDDEVGSVLLSTDTETQSADTQTTSGNETLKTVSDDSGEVLGATTGTFTQLQTLINNNYGKTITLTQDYAYDASFGKTTGVQITSAITIDGQGHALDGKSTSRIFEITGANVVLKNIKFINGYINGRAAGIEWSGDNGEISKSIFLNNHATGVNGGMYSSGKYMKITDCDFINQSSIRSNQGAVTLEGNYAIIQNSRFINNTANYEAALYILASHVQIINSIFDNNNVNGTGNAAAFTVHGVNVTVDRCIFTNNTVSKASGGAIEWRGNNGNLLNSIFDSNHANDVGGAIFTRDYNGAVNLNIKNCTFKNNSAKTGGAIYNQINNCNLSDSIFEDNSASNDGGTIYNSGSNLVLSDCVLISDDGSSLEDQISSTASVTVEGTTYGTVYISNNGNGNGLTRNTPTNWANGYELVAEGGRIIFLQDTYTSIVDQTISKTISLIGEGTVTINANNRGRIFIISAKNVEIDNIDFINAKTTESGAGIYWSGANGKISNSMFKDSYAGRVNGGIYSNGRNMIIDNCDFINLSSGANQGAVTLAGNYAIIQNSRFINNTANYEAALYIPGSHAQIINSIFDNNLVDGTGNAAAFTVHGVNVTVDRCIFTNNTVSKASGGAIEWRGNNGNLLNSIFDSNHANDVGGAIFARNYNGAVNLNIKNCTFKNNSAKTGGAIYNQINNCNLSDSIFEDNSASNDGGTIYNSGSNLVLSDCVLISDDGSSLEDQISSTASITVEGTTYGTVYISNNGNGNGLTRNTPTTWDKAYELVADGGKIIFLQDTYTSIVDQTISKTISLIGEGTVTINANNRGSIFAISAKNVLIDNIDFINGNTTDSGGAIYWSGANGIINNSLLKNNYAAGLAGAIYSAGNYLKIDNCIFDNQTVGGNQGAVTLAASYGIISNSKFYNNHAKYEGALYILGPHNTLFNCLFDNNYVTGGTGSAGALTAQGKNTTIINCNFTNNKVLTGNGGAIEWRGDDGLLKNSIFRNNGASNNGGAINIASYQGQTAKNLEIINCTFENNYATNSGGAIHNTVSSTVTVSDSSFESNTAKTNDAISSSKEVTITNCEIENQISITVTGNNAGSTATLIGTFSTSAPTKIDIYLDGNKKDTVTVNNNKFTYQFTDLGVGEHIITLKDSNGNTYEFDEKLIETASTIYVATTEKSGATGLTSTSPVLWSKAIKYINSGGKIIFAAGSYSDVINQVIDKPLELQGTGTVNLNLNNNRAFNIDTSGVVKITNLRFNNGKADNGAAIYITKGDVDVISSTFTSNTATANGGAIYVANGAFLDVEGSTFTSNTANTDGGALYYATGSQGTITTSTFKSNKGKNGAAIYFACTGSATNALTNSKFESNEATNGAVYWLASSTLSDLSFTSNKATTGGAIYTGTNTVLVTKSNFTGNTATNYRNVYTTGSKTTLTDDRFDTTVTLTITNKAIYYGETTTIKGTFNDGNNIDPEIGVIYGSTTARTTVSGNQYSVTTPATLTEGTYAVSLSPKDNSGNTYVFTAVSDSFKVSKNPVTLTVKPSYDDSMMYGQYQVYEVDTGKSDATGTISVEINSHTYTNTTLVNGKARIVVNEILSARDQAYEATIIYSGSVKYAGDTVKDTFNVNKYGVTITVDADDVYVDKKPTLKITVVGDDSSNKPTGSVNITINGVTKQINLGSDATATYNWDGDLTSAGYAFTIAAHYNGNERYSIKQTGNAGSFNLLQYTPVLKVTVNSSDIKVDENVKITFEVDKNGGSATPTGRIVGKFFGVNIDDTLTNGKLEKTIRVTNVNSETLYVESQYVGDYNYKSVTNNTVSVKVSKHVPTITITTLGDKMVDSDLLITATLSGDDGTPTGNVTFTVDSKSYTVKLDNGVATQTVKLSAAKTYTIEVSYDHDDKYLTNKAETTVTYSLYSPESIEIRLDKDNYKAGDDVTVHVQVNGGHGNMSGYVDVYIDNANKQTITLNATGYGNYTYKGLAAKDNEAYTAKAEYLGNYKYSGKETDKIFNIIRYTPTVTITIPDTIYVDDVVPIQVTVSGDYVTPTGKVNFVTRSGQTDNFDLVDGTYTYNYAVHLNETHTFTVNYGGDDYYRTGSSDKITSVLKYATTVSAEIRVNPKVDDEVTIYVTVAADNLTNIDKDTYVTVGSTDIYIGSDGTGSGTFKVTENRTYTLTVTYHSNYKYDSSYGDALVFNVAKWATDVDIWTDNTNIKVEDTIVVQARVISDNMAGIAGTKVRLTSVTGRTADIILDENGYGNVSLKVQEARDYNITGVYEGSEKFDSSSDRISFKATKYETQVIVNADNIKVDDNVIIKIKVINLENASITPKGNVSIYVFGQTNIVELNATGEAILDNVTITEARNFTISATYLGDYEFNKTSATKDFEATKYKPEIEFTVESIMVDGVAHLIVQLTSAESNDVVGGTVIVTGSQGTYEFKLNETGGYDYAISNLNATDGNVTVTAAYQGNYKYESVSKSVTNFSVSKYDTVIEIDVDDATVFEDVKITVRVIAATNANITNASTVTIWCPTSESGVANQTVVLNADGTATVNFGKLENNSNHLISVSFSGNYKFKDNSAQKLFSVGKVDASMNTDISVDINEVKVGQDAIINVTIKGQDGQVAPTGWVFFTVNGQLHRVKLENYTFTDSYANITLSNLQAKDYNISVAYLGDGNYFNASSNHLFTVSKWASQLSVFADPILRGQNATVRVKVTSEGGVVNGTVRITVDGKSYDIILNETTGEGSQIIKDLNASSSYPITATYISSEKFLESVNNTQAFSVTKYASNLEIRLGNVKAGQDAILYVRVYGENGFNFVPSGNVTVLARGNSVPVILNATGEGVLPITNLTAGETYIVQLRYEGDRNFLAANDNATFDVDKNASRVFLTINPIHVGQVLYINVTVESVEGGAIPTGTVKIIGYYNNYTITLDNKTGKGGIYIPGDAGDFIPYTNGEKITAAYGGDHYYRGSETTADLYVYKNESRVEIQIDSIHVGQDAVVKVWVYGTVGGALPTGNVTITGRGTPFDVELTTTDKGAAYGERRVSGLTYNPGYTVSAKYNGDANYTVDSTSTSFKIDKNESTLVVNITSIHVGESLTITVNVTGTQGGAIPTGYVIVTGFAGTYNITIDSTTGIGTKVIPTNTSTFKARDYNVTAIYYGDANYTGSEHKDIKYTITKNESSISNFVIESIQVGEKAYIYVTVTGTENGAIPSGKVRIAGLKDETIEIDLDENGQGVKEVEGLGFKSTGYIVSAQYVGDDNYTETANIVLTPAFEVRKNNTNISITIDEVHVGENATIHVKVDANATTPTGRVYITINSNPVLEYNIVDLQNGEGEIQIAVLPHATYTVTAFYYDDQNIYNTAETSKHFTVLKNITSIEITIPESINVGENVNVSVTVKANSTIPRNNITISLDGEEHEVPLDANGKGSFEYKAVGYGNDGTRTVNVKYAGDDNYENIPAVSKQFTVNKNSTRVIVTVENINVTQKAIIHIKVEGIDSSAIPSGNIILEGFVSDNVKLNASGEYVYEVSGLSAREDLYQVSVTYKGDENFTEGTVGEASFRVSKWNTTVDVVVNTPEIKVGDDATLTITVNGLLDSNKPSGKVYVGIAGEDGEEYDLDENSQVTVPLSGLITYGKTYRIDVRYRGDDYNAISSNNPSETTVHVTRHTTQMNVTVKSIFVDDNIEIEFRVNGSDANGTVTFGFGNDNYTISITNGYAKAVIKPDNYTVGYGVHGVFSDYSGDYKYEGTNNHTQAFTIYRYTTNITASVKSVDYGTVPQVIINVTSAGGIPQGNISFRLNNKDYTKALGADGTVVVDLDNEGVLLEARDYVIERVSFEDNNYKFEANHTDELRFSVNRVSPNITIELNHKDGQYKSGDEIEFTVTLINGSAIGTDKVHVTITGLVDPFDLELENGAQTKVLGIIRQTGTYTISVSYTGNDVMVAGDASKEFTVSYATFEDLQKLIDEAEEGANITLDRDYVFGEGDSIVNITKNITINGNGYTINATGQSGIFNVTGDGVTIANVTLTEGNSDEGGAIIWSGANGNLENATLINNTATEGGAIKWTGENATIKDSEFIDNSANEGGAVVIDGSNANVENATFTGNNATNGAGIVLNGNNATVKDSEFKDNTATESGAGVISTGNGTTIENSVFENNTAETGAGVVLEGNNATVSKSNFTNNTATDSGAGVVVNGEGNNITGSNFENNTAQTGAGVVINGNNTNVKDSDFTGNNATNGAGVLINGNNATVKDSDFANNTATDSGAGIVSKGNGTNIEGSTFTNNTAETGAGVVLNGNNATVSDSNFTQNTANDSGAGIVSNGDGTNITGSNFENNTAQTGAGVVIKGNNATVENSNFTANKAEEGAGIISSGNGTNVEGSTFKENEAETGAGVILNGNNATVKDSDFANNTATESGAGVVANGNGTNIESSNFENNTAQTGAGVVINGNNATVENSNFTANNAEEGAGIISSGNGTTVKDSDFTNNTAQTGAGIVSKGDNTNITGSEFTGNNATNGAGVVLEGNDATVENSNFTQNTATETGAGIVSSGNGTNITGSKFEENTAETGAGVVLNGDDATVSDSNFTANTASEGAGIVSTGDNTNITGSDFENNNADYGAGIVLDGKNSNVENATFSGNNATGGSAILIGNNSDATPEDLAGNNFTDQEDAIAFNPEITIDVVDLAKVGDDVVITVKIDGADSGEVTLTIGNIFNETKVISEGSVQFTVKDLAKGTYTVDVYYAGNEKFTSGSKSKEFEVNYATLADLQKLIDGAKSGDVITLDKDYIADASDVAIIINKENITINGNGHTIDANGTTSVFTVDADNVVIANITIINGKSDDGGAIVWNGDNGTVEGATFINNSAENGGAILWNGDNATIKDTTFEKNNASEGGAVLIKGNDATVENSNFTANTAETGAGIISTGNGTTIAESEFTDNSAETGAGVVLNGNNATVEGSTFANNTATESGAGVVVNGNGTNIAGTEFTGNEAKEGAGVVINGNDAAVENATFTDNTAETGAGIVSTGNGTTITDSEFVDNKADEGAGVVLNGNDATVEGSTFANNTAKVSGAGVVVNGNGTNITDSEFTGNEAKEGAGVVINGNDATVDNATFTDNTADKGAGIVSSGNGTTVSDSTFEGNNAHEGAGIVSTGDNTNITGSEFVNNTADKGAGVILEGNDATVSDSNFTANKAEEGAGIVSTGDNTNITGTAFTDNTAETGAGAVLEGNNANVENTTFTGNEATTGAGVVANGNGTTIKDSEFTDNKAEEGAGAVLNGENSVVDNATFAGNEATTGAGIVSNGNGTNVTGSKFENNSAEYGAGVVINSGNTTVSDSEFTGNNATSGSAVLIGENSDATAEDIIGNNTGIESNDVSLSPEIDIITVPERILVTDDGKITITIESLKGKKVNITNPITGETAEYTVPETGVIEIPFTNIAKGTYTVSVYYAGDDTYSEFTQTKKFTVDYPTFNDLQELINKAAEDGTNTVELNYDYVYKYGDSVITLPDNFVLDGKGHTLDGAGESSIIKVDGDNVKIINVTLANGRADEGGAVVWNGANGTIESTTFENNSATNGGAILWNGDNATIKDSEFVNNTADVSGGAVLIKGNNTTVENANFTENSAETGAGIMIQGNNATVKDSEFTGNDASEGAGVYTTGDETTIEGTKFTNNTAETGAGVVSDGKGTTIADSEFTGNNATEGAGAVLNGNDATVKDSEFTDNTAETGAGVVLNGNDATVEGSNFTNNSAETGAGIVSNGDKTTIKDSNFTDNKAEEGAGAVLNGNEANVEGSTFANNTATESGAGVVSNGNATTIKGSTFENNSAETGAGAVLNGNDATVEDTDFVSNTATEGAGIVSNGNDTTVKDSTFENNTAESGAGIAANGANTNVENSEFTGNNASSGSAIAIGANATNTVVDPISESNIENGGNTGTPIAKLVDLTVDYNDTYVKDKFNVTVKVSAEGYDGKGIVTVTINGVPYNVTLENGIATIEIDAIDTKGVYNVTVKFTHDEFDTKIINNTIEVLDKSSTTANDVTRGYNSGNDFQATLVDKYGNPIANTVVEFTVDGKVYKVKTNANGVATLSIKLAVGKHKITVKNPSTGATITKTANIVKRITNNKNVNVFYLTKATYKVRVYGDNGNVAGKGVKVKFVVGGKTYYRTTDKNGWATLKVSLKPKTYKVTAEFKGYKVSNKIVVKHIIKAKKTTTTKKSKKLLKIKVTLKGKKVFKKKKLTIKFKGKKYKVKTNKKGVAYFKVKKNVLSKLKKGKKYKYTITYKKDKLTRYIKVK